MTLLEDLRILETVRALQSRLLSDISDFVNDRDFGHLASRYRQFKMRKAVDIGFNLFELIAERFYREELHSDLLTSFLDPSGKHGEGYKFLHLFLAFIASKGAKINVADFDDAQVLREDGRIDILIKSNSTKCAIIVENKINAAFDQPRQIPRYLEHVEGLGFSCQAVVYLRLNDRAGPDTTGWSHEDRQKVQSLLQVVVAYEEGCEDLVTGWLGKCGCEAVSEEVRFAIKQYAQLIKKLGINTMNKPLMAEFHATMRSADNFKTALSLYSMLDELTTYRQKLVLDTFQRDSEPFNRIVLYQNLVLFKDLFIDDSEFGIDLGTEREQYVFFFWDRNDLLSVNGRAKDLLEKMGWGSDFQMQESGFVKYFAFPEKEDEMFDYIRRFRKRLAEVIQ